MLSRAADSARGILQAGWRLWAIATVVATAMLAATVFGVGLLSRGGDAAPASILFGAAANGPADFSALESEVGRPLAVRRIYANWDDAEPSYDLKWDIAQHVRPILSIDAQYRSGKVVPWAEIAAGRDDAAIDAQADALKATAVPIFLDFSHEPEYAHANGNASNFIAAWRHYVSIFRQRGATNVTFVLILGAALYNTGGGRSWYPGNTWVDWIASDGYNWNGCVSPSDTPYWKSFSQVFSLFHAFGVAHSKPLMVAEWGSVEDPHTPGRKAQWITDAAATIKSWPTVHAVSYLDLPSKYPGCNFHLDTSTSSMAAFKAMANDPYFGG